MLIDFHERACNGDAHRIQNNFAAARLYGDLCSSLDHRIHASVQADNLVDAGSEVRIFLMSDAVDMAREVCRPPEGYDQDLSQMLKALIARGVTVKVCGTCMARCGIYKNHPYFEGAEKSTMPALAEWVMDSDKVVSF